MIDETKGKNSLYEPKTVAIYRQFQAIVSNRQEKDRWKRSGKLLSKAHARGQSIVDMLHHEVLA